MAVSELGVKAGTKAGVKKAPSVPAHASFVIGSRPPGLRAPAIQRIKPAAASTTDYGKIAGPSPTPAGNTGQTPWS